MLLHIIFFFFLVLCSQSLFESSRSKQKAKERASNREKERKKKREIVDAYINRLRHYIDTFTTLLGINTSFFSFVSSLFDDHRNYARVQTNRNTTLVRMSQRRYATKVSVSSCFSLSRIPHTIGMMEFCFCLLFVVIRIDFLLIYFKRNLTEKKDTNRFSYFENIFDRFVCYRISMNIGYLIRWVVFWFILFIFSILISDTQKKEKDHVKKFFRFLLKKFSFFVLPFIDM